MHRTLFVTGKLAEQSLRTTLAELQKQQQSFEYHIEVLPITVAALMTTDWIGKKLKSTHGCAEIIIPGLCRGELAAIPTPPGVNVRRGPKDLREIPTFFGSQAKKIAIDGSHSIEILAEINHAPDLGVAEIVRIAEHYRTSGADIIDLGCNPQSTWHEIRIVVQELCSRDMQVSVDSFNPTEVELALQGGAKLVLSVNQSNCHLAQAWHDQYGAEVVAIPDQPSDLDSLRRTAEFLDQAGISHRLDPILEPIGFGFAASLGRYLQIRQEFPHAPMMMGVGNLTELTDVDSAGINVLLAGFCQEQQIQSVLLTEVINWCRSAVAEFHVARQLVHQAHVHHTIPKNITGDLVMLRDPRLFPPSAEEIKQLAERLTDRNYRIFLENNEIIIMNRHVFLRGTDPFAIFRDLMAIEGPHIDQEHAFYLGYEFAKAVTAQTLGKNYYQDQALRWGLLTVEEPSHYVPREG
ncbi:MAG: DUF6513 domain-containing protein [Zavarzinella sp.]